MPEIKRNEPKHCYEAFVDGRLAGVCDYVIDGSTVTFTHTAVSPEFEGQGVGSALARYVLEDSRAQGKSVIPACEFIRDYISGHSEFASLVS